MVTATAKPPKQGQPSLHEAATNGQVYQWHCYDCGHNWRAHGRLTECGGPACGSKNITRVGPTQAPADETKPASDETPAAVATGGAEITLSFIGMSPTNTRKHFDPEKLAALADSIKKHGVLEPVLVRRGTRKPGDILNALPYELIAGERRYRAAKIAKLPTIPARILDVTDEEALEIQARENLDREDLDPIERALTFQQLMEKNGYTQETLAKRFKVSPASISDSIRLLQLPEPLQNAVITRVISQTHAREVMPWSDLPSVMEKVLALDPADWGSLNDFKCELAGVLEDCSRSMEFDGDYYDSRRRHFKPTKDQLAQLDVRKVPHRWGNRGEKEDRAFNVELWKELQTAANKAHRAKQPKRKTAGGDSYKAQQTKWAEERKRDDFRRQLYFHKRRWLMGQILERFKPDQHAECALRLLLAGCMEEKQALHKLSKSKGHQWSFTAEKALGVVIGFKGADLERVACDLLSECLREKGEHRFQLLEDVAVGYLADAVGVDFVRGWRPSIDFLQLFDTAARAELVKSFPAAEAIGAAKYSNQAIIDNWPAGYIPEDLRYVDDCGQIRKPKKTKPAKK